MKIYLILIIFFSQLSLFSQDKHDFQWVFCYGPNNEEKKFGGSLISFDQNDIKMNYVQLRCELGENVSYSNDQGSLLMYSNGCAIFGSDHEVILNGQGINPGVTYDNYCLDTVSSFYPKRNFELFLPGFSKDTIYLFHLGIKSGGGFVMNLFRTTIYTNDTKSQVVEKNKAYGPGYAVHAGIQAIRHGNGRDWWIIMKHAYTNYFNKFLLTPSGLSNLTVQAIGPDWGQPSSVVQASFSPDGRYYAIASEFNGLHLFHFDRCKGELSRYLPLKHPEDDDKFIPMGVAFSADSKFLYVSSKFSIYQYDLSAQDIVNSYILIDTLDGYTPPGSLPLNFYQLLLAPDHKIYCNTTNATNLFHVIQYPNRRGKFCNLRQHHYYLPTYYFQSMPNFPHYRLYDVEGSPCDTLGVNKKVIARFRYEQDSSDYLKFDFTDLSFYQPDTWFWEFGDYASSMNTSSERYPDHVFSEVGIYTVCLTVSNVHGSDKICQDIQIGPVSNKDIRSHIDWSKQVLLSPNPCAEVLQIKVVDYYPKKMMANLLNNLGQKVKQIRVFEGINNVDVSKMIHGLYYLQFVEDGTVLGVEPIVVGME